MHFDFFYSTGYDSCLPRYWRGAVRFELVASQPTFYSIRKILPPSFLSHPSVSWPSHCSPYPATRSKFPLHVSIADLFPFPDLCGIFFFSLTSHWLSTCCSFLSLLEAPGLTLSPASWEAEDPVTHTNVLGAENCYFRAHGALPRLFVLGLTRDIPWDLLSTDF